MVTQNNRLSYSPFFAGRHEEMETLHKGLSHSFLHSGKSFLITGDAGLGKSRLLQEVLEKTSSQFDFIKIEYAFLPTGTANVPLLKSLFAQCQSYFEHADDIGKRLEIIADKAGLMHPSIRETLYGLAGHDQFRQSSHLDENTRKTLAASVIWDILNYLSTVKPVVLVIEDIHWATIDLKFFLQSLDQKLHRRKIALLLSTRDSPSVYIRNMTDTEAIRLKPLRENEQEELLHQWLGFEDTLESLKIEIASICQGNPLFIHEIVLALARNKDLNGSPGNFKLSQEKLNLLLPYSLRTLIETQLRSLTDGRKLYLECAAAIGLQFEKGLLLALAGEASVSESAFSYLVNAGIIYRKSETRELYQFSHALVYDAVYCSMPEKRKMQFHAALFSLLRAGPRTQEKVALCAHHAVHAGMLKEAFIYNYIAGNHAISHSDGARATTFFQTALENLDQLPSSFSNKNRHIVKCQIGLAFALSIQGRHADTRRLLKQAEVKLKGLNTKAERVQNKLKSLGLFDLWIQGDLINGIETGAAFLSTLDLKKDSYNYVTTSIRLAGMFQDCGRYEDSNQVLQSLKDFFKRNNAPVRYGLLFPPSTTCHSMMSRNYGELGQYKKAEEHALQCRDLLKYNKNVLSAIYGLTYSSSYLIRSEQFDQALIYLSEAHQRCLQIKTSLLYPIVSSQYGFALFRSGQVEKGFELMEEARYIARSQAAYGRQALYIQILAEAKLINREFEAAQTLALEAIRTGGRYSEWANVARSHYILGLAGIRAETHKNDAASHLRRARDMAESLNLQPLLVLCNETLRVRAA